MVRWIPPAEPQVYENPATTVVGNYKRGYNSDQHEYMLMLSWSQELANLIKWQTVYISCISLFDKFSAGNDDNEEKIQQWEVKKKSWFNYKAKFFDSLWQQAHDKNVMRTRNWK